MLRSDLLVFFDILGPRGFDGRAGKQGPPGNFGPQGSRGKMTFCIKCIM